MICVVACVNLATSPRSKIASKFFPVAIADEV